MSVVPKKVEVKTTIEEAGVGLALERLGLRLAKRSTTSLIVFCETSLDGGMMLTARSLIVRLRWRIIVPPEQADEASNDCTVKVRPSAGDSTRWSTAANGPKEKDKFEGDWTPSQRVNTFSRRVEGLAATALEAVMRGSAPVEGLLAPGQRLLLKEALSGEVPKLRPLAPVLSTTWQLPGRRDAELWTVGPTHFLEISERVDAAEAEPALANLVAFVHSFGGEPSEKGAKTDRIIKLVS